MSGAGRGRGEGKLTEDVEGERQKTRRSGMDVGSGSESEDPAAGGSERVIRGRGGYRTAELNTIPPNIALLRSPNDPSKYRDLKVIANFVGVTPMQRRIIYQYRVDFSPNIESTRLRRRAFLLATEGKFSRGVTFDGMYDARSSDELAGGSLTMTVQLEGRVESQVEVKVKQVGTVPWQSFEMLRLYNTNMKSFLRSLGFFQVSKDGACVHAELRTALSDFRDLYMVRGFRTAVNVHEQDRILMNLEPVHKLMQAENVMQMMMRLRSMGGNFQQNIKQALVGKLCVTSYNKAVYRIEDINFDLNPSSTFRDERANQDVTYQAYYQQRYDLRIVDARQPLLLVVPNNRRRAAEDDREIYLIPELCNIAGLTDEQRNNSDLKMNLIQTSQVLPKDRVAQMRQFLGKFHTSEDVARSLNKWGYTYDKDPVEIVAKQMHPELIGIGKQAKEDKKTWPRVDYKGSFDQLLLKDSTMAVTPAIRSMAVFIASPNFDKQGHIIGEIRKGFEKVGLAPEDVRVVSITEGDTPHHYVHHLRHMPDETTCAIVILNRQNKDRYDAVKKLCTVERGLITQVVTAKLMTHQKKMSGAAVKIAVQMAAKVGGEPWFADLPLKNAMICGYDTYHDSAKRGRSFGAFVATTNDKFSRWFSRADPHDRLEELSAQVANNMRLALQRYKTLNNDRWPDRVFLYRDGVSEGDLEHVFNVEVQGVKQVLVQADPAIKFTMIVVCKRVGARFYACQGNTFDNPPPGTIIDDVVTRKERYDFYLVSQYSKHGTVTPTYYNIIHDESGLAPHIHQAMAYKLSMLYYNWTGTIRVPAPCQYAHKLALLCGEHLHAQPNSRLDDRLHFL